mgnify:CR=1 FL=1
MKWWKLKSNQCPACFRELVTETNGEWVNCTNCQFYITEQRFQALINKMVEEEFRRDTEEQENKEKDPETQDMTDIW